MDALQLRLQEPENAPLREGLSVEARMLCDLSEIRQKIKSLTAFEKALATSLKDHILETGEKVTNGAQMVNLTEITSYDYMDATFKQECPEVFDMVATVSQTKVTALLKAGVIDPAIFDKYRKAKATTYRVTIVEDKGK